MKKLYHPDIELIKRFVTGELEAGPGLLVKAHLNNCEDCRIQAESEFESQANNFFYTNSNLKLEKDVTDDIFNFILDKAECTKAKVESNNIHKPPIVKFQNKTFSLPETFSFISDKDISWKEFGKNSAVAQVTSGKTGGLYFIYLGPGETIPKHGHHGREYSYVLDGYYSSNGHKLDTGDFSTFEESDIHEPSTTSEDGCLVVSWVENRLNFLHGVFTPLNQLLWWYLKRS
ncbi:anti-sigma factor, putative, ChrR family [Bacteriovorax sp. BAL6_X]|uniref:cupin domain-containing protein n=1 Tax=Bacteriovorax sp. BAL6_X TaxID=1201290 RepID=UPI00038588C6|nr:cupin domain-containing protein [Bacteriovorax sp. BAL6_X]EPZ49246.1 anti-sigma factor, putative, ChrR family [Bacteriovorax sp. BAL6_X]